MASNVVDFLLRARGQAQANKALDSVGMKLDRVAGSAGRVAASLGIAFGTTGMLLAGKNALDTADKMEKLERRLGISTEALSEMKFAAEQSGVSFETMTMGIQRMTRRVAEAASGTGEARTALLEMGLDAEKLNALAPEAQFEAIARSLSEVGDSGDKARLAMKLFDSEGVALLQMTDDIKELRLEARDMGLTLSHEAAVGAAEANDALNRTRAAMNVAAQEAAINLTPAITTLGNALAEKIPEGTQFAVDAFFQLRKTGLQTFSFLIHQYASFKEMVAGGLEFLNLDTLAQQEQEGADFLNRYAAQLLDTAQNVEVVTGKLEEQSSTLREIHAPAVEEVASEYGKLTLQQAQALLKTEEQGEAFQLTFGEGTQSLFEQMRNNFKKALNNMLNDLLNQGFQGAFAKIFNSSGGGGGGGLVGGFIGSIFGGTANTGTSFTVPNVGAGGTDKTLVTVAANPDERIDFVPKSQQGKGSGINIINQNSYDFRGSTLTEAQVDEKISRASRQLKHEIQKDISTGRM